MALRTTSTLATVFYPILLVLVIQQSQKVWAGKMFTPLGFKYKVACLAEHLKEAGTTYICDKEGHVRCLPGWSDESILCKTPICEIDGETCQHGNCTAPGRCECEVGWYGDLCDKCVTLPGCKNGYCEFPLQCICEEGWSGLFCHKPICAENCSHGHCTVPGECVCHPGWFGPNCDQCMESPDCVHGRCVDTPLQCQCYDGYQGTCCEEPKCSEGCHPEHGICMHPEECWCKGGWQGVDCSQCIPYWNCVNGYCDEPHECKCFEGFVGKDCNSTMNQDGNWGQWGAWSTCSATCGSGIETRKRLCNDPKPTGDGQYCSKDGSVSTETRPCPGLISCSLGWSAWSTFGTCSVTCGSGLRIRSRECLGDLSNCPGPSTDSIECDAGVCWSQWSDFGPCSVTCGLGLQTRTRTCLGDPSACPGVAADSIQCDAGPCWSQWSDFGPCSTTCGSGEQTRTRSCLGDLSTCLGANTEIVACEDLLPCPIETTETPLPQIPIPSNSLFRKNPNGSYNRLSANEKK